MAWYVYDVEFRRRASHNLSKKWCSSSDHFTDACPLSPRSKDSPGQNHVDLCYNFNKEGSPVTAPPAPTDTSATNLDAQEPILKRTTMI